MQKKALNSTKMQKSAEILMFFIKRVSGERLVVCEFLIQHLPLYG
jgi:hypothetical protein